MIATVRDLIIFHEGYTEKAKPDAQGKWSIGFGHDIVPSPGKTCTRDEADVWLASDLNIAHGRAILAVNMKCWNELDDARRAALTDMAFELGGAGLADFHKMIAAIRAGDWQTAHDEALNSDWANQVPGRAERDARMILTGEWPTG